MQKSALLSCLVACSLGVVAACGDDDSDGAAGSGGSDGGRGGTSSAGKSGGGAGNGKAGGGGGSGGSAGDASYPIDDDNTECPNVGPATGPYVPKGECCYRTSNGARRDKSADKVVLEYRLNEFLLINHKLTIDPAAGSPLSTIQLTRAENEEQSLLFRFELPQEDGEIVGTRPGRTRVGAGRYNCDGTYSFYSKTAAPTNAGGKADRWFTPDFESVVKPDATGADFSRPSYKTALPVKNHPTYTPYLGAGKLDFEGESQGFDIVEIPTISENLECAGAYRDTKWRAAGKTIAFARLDLNKGDVIDAVGINFCGLMAFGPSAGPSLDCETEERCTPGEGDCVWKRLPDSLCPTDEAAKWGCHLGYNDNPDNAPTVTTKCQAEPLSDAQLDEDEPTVLGQCCDPLGKETGGLPACNAWLQINEFVAGSVEITDDLADELQTICSAE